MNVYYSLNRTSILKIMSVTNPQYVEDSEKKTVILRWIDKDSFIKIAKDIFNSYETYPLDTYYF